MQRTVTKAIFPVAGLGSRFLPATKSIPKEIMTLVDRPLIQYAIDEAREAGIEEFIFVTSRGKGALEDYFDTANELESQLRANGKDHLVRILEGTNMESGTIAYTRQHKALGLGHAVWCARQLIANEPFAVILPDDVISAEKSCLHQMIEAYQETGGSMVAAMEVPSERTQDYGVLDISEVNGKLVKVNGMVEKPQPSEAPSNLAVIGRYILSPSVLENLNHVHKGAGGEIQLTDAIASEISQGREVFGFRFEGKRFDCGSKGGFLQATVSFALARDDLRDELDTFLADLYAARAAAQ